MTFFALVIHFLMNFYLTLRVRLYFLQPFGWFMVDVFSITLGVSTS